VRFARAAEAAGFESLWTVEHVIWPTAYDSVYPYHPSGKMAGHPSIPLPDPLMWLAWVGAATETIRLATGILLLPERQPVVLAKELATLDVFSKGRLDLGVGIGWLREEFDALGIPFAGRAARTDEYIRVLRTLWSSDNAAFDGEYVRFSGVSSNPKPVNGTVPIFVGGHSTGAARRAGTLGDGFWPLGPTVAALGELFAHARRAAVDAGRDPDEIEFCASPPHGMAQIDDEIPALLELGVNRIILSGFQFFSGNPEAALQEAMERLRAVG
jgi:probable F420-dependent oxidoreductase